MPTPRKPPRLYLRKEPRTDYSVWVTRDGKRMIRTGCREGDEARARDALANYMVGSFKPLTAAEASGVGVIYYVSVTGSDTYPVKIGYTKGKVSRRVEDMQVGNPNHIVCLGTERGNEALERERHQQFRAYHFRGEWYSRGSALMRHIASLTGGGVIHFVNAAHDAQLGAQNAQHQLHEIEQE